MPHLARRALRGIDEQGRKAANAPVKRNRFILLADGTRMVNRDLEEEVQALAGLKGYITKAQRHAPLRKVHKHSARSQAAFALVARVRATMLMALFPIAASVIVLAWHHRGAATSL